VRGEQLDDHVDLFLLEFDGGDASEGAVETQERRRLHHEAVDELPLRGRVDYDLEAAEEFVAELLEGVARDLALLLLTGADEERDPVPAK
jgi:hypothetical protein